MHKGEVSLTCAMTHLSLIMVRRRGIEPRSNTLIRRAPQPVSLRRLVIIVIFVVELGTSSKGNVSALPTELQCFTTIVRSATSSRTRTCDHSIIIRSNPNLRHLDTYYVCESGTSSESVFSDSLRSLLGFEPKWPEVSLTCAMTLSPYLLYTFSLIDGGTNSPGVFHLKEVAVTFAIHRSLLH